MHPSVIRSGASRRFVRRLLSLALLALFVLTAAGPCRASGATEFGVSYGALPAMHYIGQYNSNWERIHPWGNVTISMDHRFFNETWLGVVYGISTSSSSAVSEGRGGAITWHSFMIRARHYYRRTGRWSFYTNIGIGVLMCYMQPEWEPTYTRTRLAFQAVPVAAQFSVLDNFDVFAEAGFGVQGILSLGVRVDF